jgi:hypothetical protein
MDRNGTVAMPCHRHLQQKLKRKEWSSICHIRWGIAAFPCFITVIMASSKSSNYLLLADHYFYFDFSNKCVLRKFWPWTPKAKQASVLVPCESHFFSQHHKALTSISIDGQECKILQSAICREVVSCYRHEHQSHHRTIILNPVSTHLSHLYTAIKILVPNLIRAWNNAAREWRCNWSNKISG